MNPDEPSTEPYIEGRRWLKQMLRNCMKLVMVIIAELVAGYAVAQALIFLVEVLVVFQ